jgi:ATPase subunit of ABC transporter with duplicated ATPase domains
VDQLDKIGDLSRVKKKATCFNSNAFLSKPDFLILDEPTNHFRSGYDKNG